MICDTETLADIFGKTVRTIAEWRRDPTFPIARAGRSTGGVGGGHRYIVSEVIEWRYDQLSDSEALSLHNQRARLAAAQADLQELRVLEARGAVVGVDAVAQTLAALCVSIRSRLMAVPTSAAPRVAGLDSLRTIQAELEVAVRDALDGAEPGVLLRDLGIPEDIIATASTQPARVVRPLQEGAAGDLGSLGAMELDEIPLANGPHAGSDRPGDRGGRSHVVESGRENGDPSLRARVLRALGPLGRAPDSTNRGFG